MKKTELTRIVKSIELPKGWKVLSIYPKHKGNKEVNETDEVVFGYPIEDRMSDSFNAYNRKIGKVLRQLNARREKRTRRWEEFGGGYGGGKWYDVTVGIGY